MPMFTILYDIRFFNGSILIKADSKEEAKEKFNKMPYSKLRQNTDSVSVEIEDVKLVSE